MSTADPPSIHEFLPQGSESDEGPVISAAGKADSAALIAILNKAQALPISDRSIYVLDQVHDAVLDGHWDTPLLRAIAENRPGNVQALLRHGADPNGIPRGNMAEHARGYRRLTEQTLAEVSEQDGILALPWPLKEENVVSVAKQILPLSEEVVKKSTGISLFWTDPMFPLRCIPCDPSSSLVMAAEVATEEIFDMLYEAGASARFWKMDSQEATELFAGARESELESSALCLSTPLHGAVKTGNIPMLKALLTRGFDPNTRALIAGSRALTPMHLAITTGNMDAYAVLASHPKADVNLRTPVYGVHTLHFAVAYLMPEQLAVTDVPISNASITRLGQTLLHIASLPIDESCVQVLAPKVQQSLHFVREIAFTESYLLPQDPLIQQGAMCKYLINSLGTAEICKVDAHGNTALHYLAGSRCPATELVEWIRSREGGEIVWATNKNAWGWTPADLWTDASAVVERSTGGNRRGRGRGRDYMGRRLARFANNSTD